MPAKRDDGAPKRRAYYSVAVGRVPGIYASWDDAKAHVDAFQGAKHKVTTDDRRRESSSSTTTTTTRIIETDAHIARASQKFTSLSDARAYMRAHGVEGHDDDANVDTLTARNNGQPPTLRRSSSSSASKSLEARARQTCAKVSVRSASSASAVDVEARGADGANGDGAAEPRSGDEPGKNRAADRYVVEFDGASRGNPGFAGAGALVKRKKDDWIVDELTEYLGSDRTVNEAEYAALCLGLRRAAELGIAHVECKGDSQLIVNQVNGVFQCKSDKLAPMHAEAMRLKTKFSTFSIEHVRREYNKHADHLANMAVDFGLAPSKMTGGGFDAGAGGLRAGTAATDGDEEVIFKRRKMDGLFTPLGWSSTSTSTRGAHTLARAHRTADGSSDDRAMATSAPSVFGASSARNAWTSRRAWVPVTRALVGFARLRL